MSEALRTSLLFLINTLFDLYILILVIRLILVWIRSDYFNPLVQFVIRMTDIIVKPIRRYIPNSGRLETVTLIWIVLFEILKFTLLALITAGVIDFIAVLILSGGDLLKMVIQTFFYAIILQAILSWVQPQSPMSYTLYQFTAPIMRPIQRVIPPVGGIDISPIPALILLQLMLIAIVGPILTVGWTMMLS